MNNFEFLAEILECMTLQICDKINSDILSFFCFEIEKSKILENFVLKKL